VTANFCPQCGNEITADYKFCPKCGSRLPEVTSTGKAETPARDSSDGETLVCPTCGYQNAAGAESCESCGSSLKHVARSKAERTDAPRVQVSASAEPQKREPPKEKREKPKQDTTAKAEKHGFRLEPTQIGYIAAAVFLGAVLTYGIMSTKSNSSSQQDNSGQADQQAQQGQQGQPSADVLHEIDRLRQVVDKNPSDLGSTLQLANMLQDNTFYDQAAVYYKRYMDKVPTNVDARVDYGVTLFEGGHPQDALVQLKEAVKENPRHQVAYFNLGIVYLNVQDIADANAAFKKCAAIDPNTDVGKKAEQTLEEHMNIQNQQEVK